MDTSNSEKLRALRGDVVSYLERHAEDSTAIGDCELVVSELINNVARHAAGPVWVAVEWPSTHPTISVSDVGPGFDLAVELPPADAIGGRGLFIVNAVVSKLEASRRASGGSVVTATLPVSRTPAVSIDPPRRRTTGLPALEEAEEGRGFGKEAFLRALVVQLAHTVAEQVGPDAAERAVAQVGTDVGGQMELEYRLAAGVVGRLDAEQLADCFVRLKHAIDGGFSVVEVTPTSIVLENDRCPFGDVVRLAPALCRMTSSVFGGIAARNAEQGAVVRLDERIAVGDAGCRVTVELDPGDDPDEPPHSHHYRAPTAR